MTGGADITVGQTAQVTVAFTPSNAGDKAVIYSSSNPAAATISSTGLITAVGAGETTISVSADNGIVETVVVTVEAA